MLKRLACTISLAGAVWLHAAGPARFVAKVRLPSGQTAVVAEGDFEARSIGSFSVRIYDPAAPGDETTFFRTGQIFGRDGTIETVTLAEVSGGAQPDLVVVARSAGTGGYRSALAFAVAGPRLALLAAVEHLPPSADPVAALRAAFAKPQ